jgi:hypothetical protein
MAFKMTNPPYKSALKHSGKHPGPDGHAAPHKAPSASEQAKKNKEGLAFDPTTGGWIKAWKSKV